MATNKHSGGRSTPKKSAAAGSSRAAKAAATAKAKGISQPVQASSNPTRDAIKVLGYTAQQRSRLRNLLTLGAAVVFVGTIAVVSWVTDGEIFSNTWQLVQSYEAPGAASRDAAINCANPKNRNTPYCDKRAQQQRTTWNGITRNQDGKAAAFTLHGQPD